MTLDRVPTWPLTAALILSIAIGVAVFFHGDDIRWLAAAELLLLTALALALLRDTSGLRLPLTPLSVSLSAFWLWLAVSLAWSRVSVTSVLNFWWVGSFALVFWTYTLSSERSRIAAFASYLVLAGALVLSAWAVVQLFAFGQPPRASFINIHSFAALLMLVALPTAGYWLTALASGRRRAALVSGAALLLLFFTIALTRGRGTSLALWLAVGLLIALHVGRARRRHLLSLAGLLAAAYGVANALLFGELGDRFATLTDPEHAASPRLLIWQGAWQMLHDAPWWGIGLGTYYLAWPPYRHPADQTLGFYVHNDYLQIWIETGLPGLLLLLAVLLATAVGIVRYLRRSPASTERTEVAALGSGLFAVAAHSFLDFNLYTLSISMLVGVVLGRLHELLLPTLPTFTITLSPARHLRPSLYRFSVLGLVLVPMVYLAAVGVSDYYFMRGMTHAARGELQQAERALHRSHQLAPASNKSLAYADLLRHALRSAPKDAMDDRRTLYIEAHMWLDRSLQANPYQAMSHLVRGRLYEEQPDLDGGDATARAEVAYREALALNPRLYPARMYWAEMLLRRNEIAAARELLEQGLIHWYPQAPALIGYYELAARVRRAGGDPLKAAELDRRVQQMRAALAAFQSRAPVRDAALLQSLAQ